MLEALGMLARPEAEYTDEAAERAENLVEAGVAAREFDESPSASRRADLEEVRPPPLARFLEQIALLGEADAETPEARPYPRRCTPRALSSRRCSSPAWRMGRSRTSAPGPTRPAERDAAEDEERRLHMRA